MPAFFLTGTDTDVGKTRTAVALLTAARAAGLSTLGLKPVAAGCEQTPQGLRNADALALMAASSLSPLMYEEVNPVALPEACAPHIAAARAGRRLGSQQLAGFVRGSLSRRAGLTLVEGAGGWRVPLNDRECISTLAQSLRLPVILVVGLRLGCINAALLSGEAILRDGLTLAGWVGSQVDPDMPFLDENVAALRQRLGVPCLGVLPWAPAETPAQTAAHLDLSLLLPASP